MLFVLHKIVNTVNLACETIVFFVPYLNILAVVGKGWGRAFM